MDKTEIFMEEMDFLGHCQQLTGFGAFIAGSYSWNNSSNFSTNNKLDMVGLVKFCLLSYTFLSPSFFSHVTVAFVEGC